MVAEAGWAGRGVCGRQLARSSDGSRTGAGLQRAKECGHIVISALREHRRPEVDGYLEGKWTGYLYCARIAAIEFAVRALSSFRPEPRPKPVEIGSPTLLRP